MDQKEIDLELACAANEEKWKSFDASLNRELPEKKPVIEGLPDYGLSGLSPKMDARCSELCRENGLDYDHVRAEFLATCQVIQARDKNPITTALAFRGLIPSNHLDRAFHAFCSATVNGSIRIRERLRTEAAQELAYNSPSEIRAS